MNEEMKKQVLDIAKIVWERRLSDVAGGNISIKNGDVVCITPKLMGYRLRWQIGEEDLSIVKLDGTVLEGPKEITREGVMHLGLYQAFDDANAIIHAHPYWTNVFVAKSRPIVPILQATEKFGTIDCIEETKGYSPELAERVIEHFLSKKAQWEKTAMERDSEFPRPW